MRSSTRTLELKLSAKGKNPQMSQTAQMAADMPRRPNRAHGAIDKLPDAVQLQVKDWYLARMTFDEITDRLNELLADEEWANGPAETPVPTINRNQVWRWIQRQRNDLERIERAKEKAEIITKHLVGDTQDVGEATEALCKAIMLEALVDADAVKAKEIDDVAAIANSLGRLATSKVARDRWEFERRKKIEEAVGALKGELQKALDGQPELTTRLLDMVDEAQGRMLEQ